ncbi:PilN domain-containing protein [Thermocrinis sp.]
MIKINLLKEKKARKTEALPVKPALKEIKISELIKLGKTEHYLSIVLWLGVLGVGVWYWRTSAQLKEIKREMDQLQVERNILSAKAQQMLEERKRIEAEINQLTNEINTLERSKDILIGLKELYIPFNNGFRAFSSSIPSTSWMITYSQTLDVENKKLNTEFELNSFDYASISAYTRSLRKTDGEVFISNVERKTNPNGYEYYFAKLTAEKNIGGK